MSLSEPLAWPFRPEQLEALAARIREWNGAVFPVAPPRWTWSSAGGGLRELAPAPGSPETGETGPVTVEVTSDVSSGTGDTDSDEFSPASEINVDPAGAPVDVSTEAPPARFSSVVDDVYANAQNRSVSFDSMSDAWTDGGHSEESPAPAPVPSRSEAKPFVPAFERDEEDDSELDIKPSERAKLETEATANVPAPKADDEDEDDGWNA